ncbi:coenzyme F420-0:L-glutamate ligase [Anaerolineales bacterium HSG6]|nr:coenzyme F420-0:L-glutamate ligase [Anaerolineales bacterium HSG6]MDM8532388.1 coenzyme F420-0:L-glutamate ligase [Anaerolineales bacterium HSG25]
MLQLIPIPNIPIVQPGDDLTGLILHALQTNDISLQTNDIVVIAQKIVSKAEDCFVDLRTVMPSAQAIELAAEIDKPAAYIEVILWDTAEIIRKRKGLLIVQHKLGFISANAGIDQSNVGSDQNIVLRLPVDPDLSARTIRQGLEEGLSEKSEPAPPVLIIDSHGRAWREGTVGVTIGLSGLAPVQDLTGQPDMFGYCLQHTQVGLTDQIAAAASLLMGQAAEACPVVVVRGLPFRLNESAKASDVLRPKESDLFR